MAKKRNKKNENNSIEQQNKSIEVNIIEQNESTIETVQSGQDIPEVIVVKKVVRKKFAENKDAIVLNPKQSLKERFDKLTMVQKILIGVLLLLILLGIIFGIVPLVKESHASSLYNKGKYEEAINVLSGMHDRSKASKIINDCEYEIAKRSAEYILENDSDLKIKDLSFVSVNGFKNALDYRNRNEISSFTAEYKNNLYSYLANYSANISKLNDGSWSVMDYVLVDSQIIPVLQCEQKTADSAVLKDYPSAVFKNINEVNAAQIEYVYELVTTERPLYKTGYLLTADCRYDPNNNIWKVNEVRKELIDSEPIPFTNVVTSIFTVNAPETWFVTRNENIYTWTNNTGEHINYNYIYQFYTDKEFSNSAMSIYVYFSADNNDSYYNGNNTITGKNIGKGVYSQYGNSIDISFWPKIRGMNSSINIYANNISIEELQPIIDSIVIGNHNYKLSVIKGPINIRSDFSTKTGAIVGKAQLGNAFTATRAMFNEGYTWYNIGENKWIADSNGEWLKVE